MAKSTRAERVAEFGKGKLISHTKVVNGKHIALKEAAAGKKKPEYKSGWQQHWAEQKEGRKIEREERGN